MGSRPYICTNTALGPEHSHRYYSPAVQYLALRVTLRQYSALLYELCAASGKPSTWLPLGWLVEQATVSHTCAFVLEADTHWKKTSDMRISLQPNGKQTANAMTYACTMRTWCTNKRALHDAPWTWKEYDHHVMTMLHAAYQPRFQTSKQHLIK